MGAPGRAHLLGGESPLLAWQGEELARGKGFAGDCESEGSPMAKRWPDEQEADSLVAASTTAACPAVSSLGACTTPVLQSLATHVRAVARSGVLQPLTIPDLRRSAKRTFAS
jgi:hypothetical protein